jgi:hypothetical protein
VIKVLGPDHASTAIDGVWRQQQRELRAEGDRLHAACVKPFERERWGEYAAVSRDGRVLFGTDLRELTKRATDELGCGQFAYKVGDKLAGRIR